MKTLKIEHIAPYLPYGLKMIFEGKGGRVIELTGITNHDKFGASITGGTGAMWLNSCGFKPLLSPLSDLTKPISHKGETLVPMVELVKIKHPVDNKFGSKYTLIDSENSGNSYRAFYKYSANFRLELNTFDIEKWPYWVVKKLYSWHFDLDNLIENGLAIDLNTLEG